MADKLTTKQQLFVAAYLGEAKGNGAQAARLAGHRGSPETLAGIASENLRKPHIKAAIDAGIEAIKQRIGPERAYGFLADVLDSDIGDCWEIGEYGTPRLDLHRAKELQKLGTIKSIQVSKQGIKVEQYDKLAAVEKILRLHGLLTDKTQITGADDGPLVVEVVKFGQD